MYRKWYALLICLAVLLTASAVPQKAEASGYAVVVDGKPVTGAQAEMVNGQLMVAVRPVVEAMGGTMEWTQAAGTVHVSFRDTHLNVYMGSNLAFQDGDRVWSPVAPYLKNGRAMVPGWWLAVRLEADVRFAYGTLTITSPVRNGGPLLALRDTYFPFPQGAVYEPYFDSMGAPRSYEGRQFTHEGTDMMARRGTPIVAVAAGTVVRYGWNTLGGYRLTMQLDQLPGYRFYYAHLNRYAPGLYVGARVRAGQLLGYVGNTGEGPERTEGKFPTHLHFGIYGPDGAVNPFIYLKYWERRKVTL